MIKPPKIGNVVEDYYVGTTHIVICDDYCKNTTPEEIQEILDRIAARALPILQKQMIAEQAMN
jgi:hypothetical protein